MTDPAGEAAGGLAVEAYVGDTRCNAGEPVTTYRALEDGSAATRYYASVAHADQLACWTPAVPRFSRIIEAKSLGLS